MLVRKGTREEAKGTMDSKEFNFSCFLLSYFFNVKNIIIRYDLYVYGTIMTS